MRERGETVNVPPEDQLKIAGRVKENYSYVCQDIVKEFSGAVQILREVRWGRSVTTYRACAFSVFFCVCDDY
jgi:hypothetical protein